MIQYFNPGQYNLGPGLDFAGSVGKGMAIGKGIRDYRNEQDFKQKMGGVKTASDLANVYKAHPDRADAGMLKQMQGQEDKLAGQAFIQETQDIYDTQGPTAAAAYMDQNAGKHWDLVQMLKKNQTAEENKQDIRDASEVRKMQGRSDQDMIDFFDNRERLLSDSNLPQEKMYEELEDLAEQRKVWEEKPDVFWRNADREWDALIGGDEAKKLEETSGKRIENKLSQKALDDYEEDAPTAREKFKLNERTVTATEERNAIMQQEADNAVKLAKIDAGITQEKLNAMGSVAKGIVKESSAKLDESFKATAELNEVLKNNVGVSFSGGFTEGIGRTFRTFAGDRDKADIFHQAAMGIVNKSMIASLPPGPASEKDMDIIGKGFPQPNASDEEFREYFDAYKRVSERVNAYHRNKMKWVAMNKNNEAFTLYKDGEPRTRTGEVFEINGLKPNKGQIYNDFFIDNEEALTTPLSVSVPGGKTYRFKDQAKAAEFRAKVKAGK